MPTTKAKTEAELDTHDQSAVNMIPCDYCKRRRGKRCRTPSGAVSVLHSARRDVGAALRSSAYWTNFYRERVETLEAELRAEDERNHAYFRRA